MDVKGKVVLVTGAANGIGRGLVERFVTEGATVVASDVDEDRLRDVIAATGVIGIAATGVIGMACDVGDVASLTATIDRVEREVGPIGLMCSNPAVFSGPEAPDLFTSEETWQRSWEVNVMSHVRAARRLVPVMVERGGGWFLQTLSAAALITSNSGFSYTVTKHAGLGCAEWIALNYRDKGIGVSCLCPTAVETRPGQFAEMPNIGLVQTPADIADIVVRGLAAEKFLILPNPAVGGSYRKKATDYDEWLVRTNARLRAMGHDVGP